LPGSSEGEIVSSWASSSVEVGLLAVDLAGLCETLRLFFAANLALEREHDGQSLGLRDFLVMPGETALLVGSAGADTAGRVGGKDKMCCHTTPVTGRKKTETEHQLIKPMYAYTSLLVACQ
jgi:hypothetical protein